MEQLTTYGALHAGDWMQSADDDTVWGVAEVIRDGHLLAVTLKRGQDQVTGYPAPDTPVTVVHQSDVSKEAAAYAALAAGFGEVEVLGERWN